MVSVIDDLNSTSSNTEAKPSSTTTPNMSSITSLTMSSTARSITLTTSTTTTIQDNHTGARRSHSANLGVAIGAGASSIIAGLILLGLVFFCRRRRIRTGNKHDMPGPSTQVTPYFVQPSTDQPYITESANLPMKNAPTAETMSAQTGNTLRHGLPDDQYTGETKLNLERNVPHGLLPPVSPPRTSHTQKWEDRQEEREQQMRNLQDEVRVSLRKDPINQANGSTSASSGREQAQIGQLREQIRILQQQMQGSDWPLAMNDEQPPAYSGP